MKIQRIGPLPDMYLDDGDPDLDVGPLNSSIDHFIMPASIIIMITILPVVLFAAAVFALSPCLC